MRQNKHLRAYSYQESAHDEGGEAQNLPLLRRGTDNGNRRQKARSYRGGTDARPSDGVLYNVAGARRKTPTYCELKVLRVDEGIRSQEFPLHHPAQEWQVYFR